MSDYAETFVERPDTDHVDLTLKVARFDPEKLIGQVGDFLLADLRATRELKPWAKMTEAEQRDLIERARGQAEEIVRQVVRAIAAKGFVKIDAQLEGGSWKEGEISAKLRAALTAENIAALSGGSPFVQVVFADARSFDAPMSARSEPNQRPLIDPETGEVTVAPITRVDDDPHEDEDDEEPAFKPRQGRRP